MPTRLRARHKQKRAGILPLLAAWLTDGLKLATLCLLLLLGQRVIVYFDSLPSLPPSDCKGYAQTHPEFASSPAKMRVCLAMERSIGL